MRLIGGVSSDKDWNSRIVAQLGFIKKHLRYPLDRNTLWPTIMVAATLPGAGILVFIMLAVKANSNYGKYWFVPILALAMLVPAVVSGRRYLQTLRFIAVPAARTLAENMLLLQRFLLHNHFAFTRHPEAPEVFQIISKSIESLKYEREVLVFVADDRRILVNSHFTHNRPVSPIGAPHGKEMAGMLGDWLRHNTRNASGTGLQPF